LHAVFTQYLVLHAHLPLLNNFIDAMWLSGQVVDSGKVYTKKKDLVHYQWPLLPLS